MHTRAGNISQVLNNPSTWMCISCYTCSDRCPKGIELTDMLWPALRDRALQDGIQPPDELQKAFVSGIGQALCKGCGTCVAACPSGSAEQNLFTNEQIFDEIEGILAYS